MIRLYSLVSFDRSAKIRWLLNELGIAFQERALNRDKKEHEAPEFLRLNPMGRVPVIEIDDQVMIESNAICTYLADRFNKNDFAPAIDSPERMKYLQWIAFSGETLDRIQARIMIIEDIPAGEVFDAKMNPLLSDLRDACETLDQALQTGPFLMGSKLSLPDICMSYQLYWLAMWPELNAIMTEFPRVTGYFERMRKHPGAIKANMFSFPSS